MFEAIISNINTGRVHRRIFDTRDEARQYADGWVRSGWRQPQNHRIEIQYRKPVKPQTTQLAAPAGIPEPLWVSFVSPGAAVPSAA